MPCERRGNMANDPKTSLLVAKMQCILKIKGFFET
jgi:hypothetical protein